MGPERGPPYSLNQFQIITEGLMVGIPQVSCQGIFSLPLQGLLPTMICFSFPLWRSVSFSPGGGHHGSGPTGATAGGNGIP